MFKKIIDGIDVSDYFDDSDESEEIVLEDYIDLKKLCSWIQACIFAGNLKEAYYGVLIFEKYGEESDE